MEQQQEFKRQGFVEITVFESNDGVPQFEFGPGGPVLAEPFDEIEWTDLVADFQIPVAAVFFFERDDAHFALVGEYPRHPVTQNLGSLSLFPQAQALEFHGEDSWQQQVFLQSDNRSWNETGELRDEIFNGDHEDESQGPLKIGLTLARSHHDENGELYDQRVAIIGDADFLSNRYLGNGSNLDIGVNLLNWLSHDDQLIAISPRPAPDTRLELSQSEQIAMASFFLILLPLGLLGSGLRIWLGRRKR